MKLDASETLLTGNWYSRGGQVIADDVCSRIEKLVGSHLIKLDRDQSGWDALYRDPDDGRLWELTYPQSHLHGGGPPQLRCLTEVEARTKYLVELDTEMTERERLPKIYADFNNKDELQRVRLNLAQSKEDIENSKSIAPGSHVILYMENEFEVEAVLDWDTNLNVWLASPIYSTLRYY